MGQVPKAITFDTFGTIIDWEGEIAKFFEEFMQKKGITGVSPKEVQQTWEEIQFDYIMEKYRPYKQVLHDTLGMTCKHFGFNFEEEDAVAFAESMGKWKAFEDSREAIKEMRKYTKVVLLTNTDNDIIAESMKNAGIEVDDIVTAEMAGCYKPYTDGFDLSRERLGLTIDEMMHAGFGFKYDVVPGNKLGYRTIWVNRQGIPRPVDDKEDIMCGDLRTLALILKGMYLEDMEAEGKTIK